MPRLDVHGRDLDDLLAAHDFLDTALNGGHSALLAQEVLGRTAARYLVAAAMHRAPATTTMVMEGVVQHDARHEDDHERGEHQLRQALGDHHAHGVDVVV